jgi:hypothetical protein
VKRNQRKIPTQKKRRRVPARPPQAHQLIQHPEPFLTPLSSQNLAKVLSNFMTFRSTIQDVSKSLAKLESILNTTYQMFETFQRLSALRKSSPGNPLFSLFSSKPFSQSSPFLPFSPHPSNNNPAPKTPFSLFEQVDIKQIFSLLQSPLFQGLLKSFLHQQNTPTKK